MGKTIDDILGEAQSYIDDDEIKQEARDTAKAGLEALLLGEDAPQNVEVEDPGYEPPSDPLVAADQAFNQSNKMWRRHIRNKLGDNDE